MTCLTQIGDSKDQQIITNKNALKIWDEKVTHINNVWKGRYRDYVYLFYKTKYEKVYNEMESIKYSKIISRIISLITNNDFKAYLRCLILKTYGYKNQ
jgi:hypothetical protein